jgi:hypothetical protein
MSHRDAGVIQAYMNSRIGIDVLAAFIGRPSKAARVKPAAHMSRFRDSRAPKDLTSAQRDGLKTHPEIIRLTQLRDRLSSDARAESGTLKAAERENTVLFHLYQETSKNLASVREILRKASMKEARETFHRNINQIEIDRQLTAIENNEHAQTIDEQLANIKLEPEFHDMDHTDWLPQPESSSPEQRLVTKFMCKDVHHCTDEDKITHRLDAMDALMALCSMHEMPRQPNRIQWNLAPEAPKQKIPAEFEVESYLPPAECFKTHCMFCFWDLGLPDHQRFHEFYNEYKARDHVEQQHLASYGQGISIPCPEPNCRARNVFLDDELHFKRHTTEQHNYDIFNNRTQRQMPRTRRSKQVPLDLVVFRR